MNAKLFTVASVLVGIGFVGGYVLRNSFMIKTTIESPTTENISQQIRQNSQFAYINPLLECEVAEGTIDAKKQNFRNDLIEKIASIKEENHLAEAAVYFRDLNNGPAFGVDDEDEFFPASLLKVPVMIAYYRWSELEPGLLSKEVLFETPRDFGVSVAIKPQAVLSPGTKYTLDELIRRMITYSDNQATYLLIQLLPKEMISGLFETIGVDDDVIKNNAAKITVKEYSSFFRILFNSSYLSRENSEKALALLATTEFGAGIVAGVPQGVKVSHKFGEAGTEGAELQLHDCGVIYFPNHPYLACIMTRGDNLGGLKQSIADISQFIYRKIDEQY